MARRFLPATAEKLVDAANELAEREQYLASTCLSSASYNFIEDTMRLVFADGSSYTYSGVDKDTYVGLITASSHGEYFNNVIRGNFPYSRG